MVGGEKLIGWLCVLHFQWMEDKSIEMPGCIHEALVERGWYTYSPEPDWDGKHFANITPAGRAIIDLHGPDWGINTIPEEEDSER